MGKLTDWGQLLRLSLGPSAAADAVAGILLGASLWPGGPAGFALLAGSLAVYHGGMALNDWSDRASDASARPERPIPSGRIRAEQALVVALGLLTSGPLLVWLWAPAAGLMLAAVACCAVLYDLRGRGPWSGPLLLGLCRAGNMGSGVLLGRGEAQLDVALLSVPMAYGLYVFIVSRLGRLEDGEDAIEERKLGPRGLILFAAAMLLAPALLAPSASASGPLWMRAMALSIGVLGAHGLVKAALARNHWKPRDILPVMGMALRRLLVFSAGVATVAGSGELVAGVPSGPSLAFLILLGYPLSHRLRRLFPPS